MNAIENFLQSKRKVVYVLLLLFCFLPMVTPPVALFTGLVFALVCGEAFPGFTKNRLNICSRFRSWDWDLG